MSDELITNQENERQLKERIQKWLIEYYYKYKIPEGTYSDRSINYHVIASLDDMVEAIMGGTQISNAERSRVSGMMSEIVATSVFGLLAPDYTSVIAPYWYEHSGGPDILIYGMNESSYPVLGVNTKSMTDRSGTTGVNTFPFPVMNLRFSARDFNYIIMANNGDGLSMDTCIPHLLKTDPRSLNHLLHVRAEFNWYYDKNLPPETRRFIDQCCYGIDQYEDYFRGYRH